MREVFKRGRAKPSAIRTIAARGFLRKVVRILPGYIGLSVLSLCAYLATLEPKYSSTVLIQYPNSISQNDAKLYLHGVSDRRVSEKVLRDRSILSQVRNIDFHSYDKSEFGSEDKHYRRVIQRYEEMLEAQVVEGASLIKLTVSSIDPNLSSEIANAHANAFLEFNRELQQITNEIRLSSLERDFGDAADAFENARMQLNIDEKNNFLEERESISERVSLLQDMADRAVQSRFKAYKELTEVRASIAPKSPGLQKTQSELTVLERELAGARKEYRPKHPYMKSLLAKVEGLKEQISFSFNIEISALEDAYSKALELEQELFEDLASEKEALLEVQELAAPVVAKEHKVDFRRIVLEKAKAQLENTDIEVGNSKGEFLLFHPASTPLESDGANAPLLAFCALLFSFATSVVHLSCRELNRKHYDSVDEIVGETQLRLLGSVPLSFSFKDRHESLKNRKQIAWDGHRESSSSLTLRKHVDRGLLDLREVAVSLLSEKVWGAPQSLLISSATRKEGKTSVAEGIAKEYAEAGKEVLVVDFDLANGSFSEKVEESFALDGLSDFFAGSVNLASIIHKTADRGISIIPVGRSKASSIEILSSVEFRMLLEQVNPCFDIIIFDGASFEESPEMLLLAKLVQKVAFVVRETDTDRSEVQNALGKIRAAGVTDIALVANGVTRA